MKLRITMKVREKIICFLNKFPSTEWSGIAFYKPSFEKSGFVKNVKLVDFYLMDVGEHSNTEIYRDDKQTERINMFVANLYKKKQVAKGCMMGLIHSHHSMGAFFSATDDEALEQMAPEQSGFYFSLVVASAKKPYAFAFSYLDQYGQSHVHELDEKDILVDTPKMNSQWAKEVKIAEKEKEDRKPAYTSYNFPSHSYNNNINHMHRKQQTTLYPTYNGNLIKEDNSYIAEDVKSDVIDEMNDYEREMTFEDLQDGYTSGAISYEEFLIACKEIQIEDPCRLIDERSTNGLSK